MAGPNLRFDFRDLAVASFHSCGYSEPFGFDLIERAAAAFERCFQAGELLPPDNRNIRIFRIDVDAVADSPGNLGRHHRRSRTEEWIVNQFVTFGVVQDWAPHQLQRLLSGVIALFFFGTTHNEFGRGRVPDG